MWQPGWSSQASTSPRAGIGLPGADPSAYGSTMWPRPLLVWVQPSGHLPASSVPSSSKGRCFKCPLPRCCIGGSTLCPWALALACDARMSKPIMGSHSSRLRWEQTAPAGNEAPVPALGLSLGCNSRLLFQVHFAWLSPGLGQMVSAWKTQLEMFKGPRWLTAIYSKTRSLPHLCPVMGKRCHPACVSPVTGQAQGEGLRDRGISVWTCHPLSEGGGEQLS